MIQVARTAEIPQMPFVDRIARERAQDPCTLAILARHRLVCEELAGRVITVIASTLPLSARSNARSELMQLRHSCRLVAAGWWIRSAFRHVRTEQVNRGEDDPEDQQADRTDDTVEERTRQLQRLHHPDNGSDDVFIHFQQLADTWELQQADTVSHDTAKSNRHVNTEDRNSYTGTKVTTSSSTMKRAQGCVTGFKDVSA